MTSISKMNKKDLYLHAKLLKEQLSTSEWFNNTLEEEIVELKKDNEKLKEENEELDIIIACNKVPEDCSIVYNSVITKLKEEIKEQNYKIDTLGKMNDKKNRYHKNKCKENSELKEEIEQLKFLLASMTCDRDSYKEQCDIMYEENEKLCEKIDIYKDAIGDYPLKDLEECIRKDLSDFSYKEKNEKLKKDCETFFQENTRLEGENEKYIKRHCADSCKIAKLKEKIRKIINNMTDSDSD